jgi:hypothetical protein
MLIAGYRLRNGLWAGSRMHFFATLTQMFLCDLPGYVPPKGGMRDKPTITLPELDRLLGAFLVEVYRRRGPSGVGKTLSARRYSRWATWRRSTGTLFPMRRSNRLSVSRPYFIQLLLYDITITHV